MSSAPLRLIGEEFGAVKRERTSSRSSSQQTNEEKETSRMESGGNNRARRRIFGQIRQTAFYRTKGGCSGQRRVSFINHDQVEAGEQARFTRNAQRPHVVCRDELNSSDKHRVSYCFNIRTEIWGHKPRVSCQQGALLPET